MSPTDLTQPTLASAGRYTFLPMGDRYAVQHRVVDQPQIPNRSRPSIETLLRGVWQQPGPRDMVQGLFEDRLQTHTFELGDVLEQIKERVAIYRQHFDELEQAKVDTTNVRRRWTDPLDRFGTIADPDLTRALQDIDAQQRQERLSCWKDLSNLRQRVPEHWRQYLAVAQHYQILGSSSAGVQKDE
ncbi:MAG: hypothetical protein ACE37H_04930 [Phycisphaeraceae bacterium]